MKQQLLMLKHLNRSIELPYLNKNTFIRLELHNWRYLKRGI